MTVTTTGVQKAYEGNGLTVLFNVDFQFWDSDELAVYKRVIATGVETLQIEGTDYSVTGGNGSTGQVDFTVDSDGAPTALEEVHIRRVSKLTQQKDFTPRTSFPGDAAEEALDRAALRAQEEEYDRTNRHLRIPVTDIPVSGTAPDMELPSTVERAVSGALLGFNPSTGDPIIVTGVLTGTVTTTAFGESIVAAADADAFRALVAGIEHYDHGDGLLIDQIGSADEASRDGASTAGEGLFISRDTYRMWQSDNSAWTELILGQYANASVPAAALAGRLYLDTDNLEILRDNGSALEKVRGPLPRGYFSGFLPTVVNSNDDIQFGVGQARCGTAANPDLVNAILGTAMTKQTDATWAEGNNAGGMASGLTRTANTWYHAFILVKPSGVVDFGFDTSVTAVNLLADAAVVAAGYTNFRRVFSLQMSATPDIKPFHQKGDWFYWDSQVLDGDSAAVTTSEVLLTAGSAPPDIKPRILMNVVVNNGSQVVVNIFDPDQTASQQGSLTLNALAATGRGGSSGGSPEQVEVVLDASQQFATYANGSPTNFRWSTVGWWDDRGRYD